WWPHEAATPVAIRHTIQRDTIYGQLSPANRQRLHAGAARVVSGTAVWMHRVAAVAGAPDEQLAAELEAVAADEHAGGRYAIAATHLLWAADLSPTRAQRERRLIAAGIHLRAASQITRLMARRQE